MVSYASLVLFSLIVAGPVMVFRATAPATATLWLISMIVSAAFFIFWMLVQLHEAFANLRFYESSEETKNLSFLREEALATEADTAQETRRQPKQVAEGHPQATAMAHGSPLA